MTEKPSGASGVEGDYHLFLSAGGHQEKLQLLRKGYQLQVVRRVLPRRRLVLSELLR